MYIYIYICTHLYPHITLIYALGYIPGPTKLSLWPAPASVGEFENVVTRVNDGFGKHWTSQ